AFENHCKVLLIANAKKNAWITVEGSANLNANPRFEQYVIVNDKALWDFHREWMEEVFNSETKNYRSTTTEREKNFRGYSIRRAGLGVTVVTKHHAEQKTIIRHKLAPTWDPAYIAKLADAIATLIAAWLPNLPPDAILTPPPQGASWPGPYFAGELCQAVAARLNRTAIQALIRTDEKHYHHPMEALKQAPF
ncbi:MAG: hypothetical protein H5T99_07030, partial [Moorella sp. (in: Bacteria)]|nr:hypothetical protein [Moorella sp. (in: firmicutes)]